MKAVKTTPRVRVPHHHFRVIVGVKPRVCHPYSLKPPWRVVDGESPGAGVGHRRDLNGLLIEAGANVPGTRSAHRSDREMTLARLARQKPCEQRQSLRDEVG